MELDSKPVFCPTFDNLFGYVGEDALQRQEVNSTRIKRIKEIAHGSGNQAHNWSSVSQSGVKLSDRQIRLIHLF